VYAAGMICDQQRKPLREKEKDGITRRNMRSFWKKVSDGEPEQRRKKRNLKSDTVGTMKV
jgi:hypothetical protein